MLFGFRAVFCRTIGLSVRWQAAARSLPGFVPRKAGSPWAPAGWSRPAGAGCPVREASSTAVGARDTGGDDRPCPAGVHGGDTYVALSPVVDRRPAGCAGTRLCRDIEAGLATMPRAFQDVEDFRLFLRLAGVRNVYLSTTSEASIGRLVGLDVTTTRHLLDRYGKDYGIMPGSCAWEGDVMPEHATFKDAMCLARRDPPISRQLLARLTGMSTAQTRRVLEHHLSREELARFHQHRVCLGRLGKLLTVVPAQPLAIMAELLSCTPGEVRAALAEHFPWFEFDDRERMNLKSICLIRHALDTAMLAPFSTTPLVEDMAKKTGVTQRKIHQHGPGLCPKYIIALNGPLSSGHLALLRSEMASGELTLSKAAGMLNLPIWMTHWYIRYYFRNAHIPRSASQPMTPASPSQASPSLTLVEYLDRTLPGPSVWLETQQALHLGEQPSAGHSLEQLLVEELLGVLALRPPLSKPEMAMQLGRPRRELRADFPAMRAKGLWQNCRLDLELPVEDILHLRSLGE
ncbi:hypothetical protein H696_05858, partial [Fonticula alba]